LSIGTVVLSDKACWQRESAAGYQRCFGDYDGKTGKGGRDTAMKKLTIVELEAMAIKKLVKWIRKIK
jgi:hypothetical protein